MKFIYTAGDYTTKDGVVFMFGGPSEVENRSTIEKLLKDPCFRRIEDEEKAEAPKAEVLEQEREPKVSGDPHACPTCGRIIRQGWYLHEKYCHGVKT